MDADYNFRLGCYHQAGHAIAYLAHGREFTRIRLGPTGMGGVEAELTPIDPISRLVITYAGPLAERLQKAGGPPADAEPLRISEQEIDPDHDDDDSDTVIILGCRESLGITNDPDALEINTRSWLVDAWKPITAVAEALIEREDELTYAEVRQLSGLDED